MKNNAIFGFTIGPIYEVLTHSQKTREFWFGSYFFSWYMREVYEGLEKAFGKENIIIPYFNFDLPKPTTAGFYPDHVIGASEKSVKETFEKIKEINKNVQSDFAERIEALIKSEKGRTFTVYKKASKAISVSLKKVDSIFADYLQTAFVCLENEKGIKETFDIVKLVEEHLLAFEKNRSFPMGKNEKTCERCKLLPSVVRVAEPDDNEIKEFNLCPFCFFKLRAHYHPDVRGLAGLEKTDKSIRPFPSIMEISAGELKRNHQKTFDRMDEEGRDDLRKSEFRQPERTESDLRPYHKYMAIIQADGDSLRKILQATGDPMKLSNNLFSFAKEVDQNLTKKYGAKSLYLGGDDILIFAPLFYEGKTVLDLVSEIKKQFKVDSEATISFGVNIFYYKSPLSIALKDTNELLYSAKNEPGKNTLALQLTQNSGQRTRLKFSFAGKSLDNFNILLKQVLKAEKEKKHLFPHSIHHKLGKHKVPLTNISEATQIDNYFKNQFNEPVHSSMSIKDDIKAQLLEKISTQTETEERKLYPKENLIKAYDNFLSQLRFIAFLIGEQNE